MEVGKHYPIKYAVLELTEPGGWLNHYEDITRGYIASKCYVLESTIKYSMNGVNHISHKVIFPYTDIQAFKLSLQNGTPDIGRSQLHYNLASKPRIVHGLFDNYNDAKRNANYENEHLKQRILSDISYPITSPKFKQLSIQEKKKLLEEQTICNYFEQLIELETQELEVTPKEDFKKLYKY